MHGRDRVAALEPLDRLGHRFGKVALVVRLDEVGDRLGVGLRAQDVALGGELLAQGHVVLDDAVVNDGDLAVAVDVRMGVVLARTPVRRPSGMPDTRVARRAACLRPRP